MLKSEEFIYLEEHNTSMYDDTDKSSREQEDEI
jgi:hypothetical protein